MLLWQFVELLMLSGMVGNYAAGTRFVAGKSSVLVGTATLHLDSAGSSTSCSGGVRRVFELLLPGGVLETFVPWHALAIAAASKILRDSVNGPWVFHVQWASRNENPRTWKTAKALVSRKGVCEGWNRMTVNRPAHLQHLLIDMIGGRKHDCGSPALVQVKVELGYSCVGLMNNHWSMFFV